MNSCRKNSKKRKEQDLWLVLIGRTDGISHVHAREIPRISRNFLQAHAFHTSLFILPGKNVQALKTEKWSQSPFSPFLIVMGSRPKYSHKPRFPILHGQILCEKEHFLPSSSSFYSEGRRKVKRGFLSLSSFLSEEGKTNLPLPLLLPPQLYA